MRSYTCAIVILCSILITAVDGCSKKKEGKRRGYHGHSHSPPYVTTTSRPDESCDCAPLSQCPELENVLKGPKPIEQSTLRALQRATCYPVKQPRDPNVRCCPEYIEPVTDKVSPEWSSTTPLPPVLVDSSSTMFSQCGVCGNEALVQRIVGGIEAGLGQFPWIARLGYSRVRGHADSANYQCGGSLINEYYVITAAHCVVTKPKAPKLQWVRFGEHDENSREDCDLRECAPPTQDVRALTWRAHPQYNANTYRHDIAVVRLASPVSFSRWIHPICVPVSDLGDLTGRSAVVAGWGTTEPGVAIGSNVLQTLWKNIVNDANCTRRYRNIADIKPGQFCAGGKKGEDSCAGDSGGPLALPVTSTTLNKKGSSDVTRYFLVGLVSFGARLCGAGDLPGVYTNIQFYIPWITKTVSELDKEQNIVSVRLLWRN